MMTNNFKFLNKTIKLELNQKVFTPNLTTQELIKAACGVIEKRRRRKKKLNILDLGCGSGVIGIFLKKKYPSKVNVFLSDHSEFAVELAKRNSELNNTKLQIVKSDLFKMWKKYKFDLIIDDISAISSYIAKKSVWYNKFIPCKSGASGLSLTKKIIDNCDKFLNKNSIILIPSISISDHKKNISIMKRKFKKVKLLSTREWPAPLFLLKKNLKKKSLQKGYIYEKFNMLLCFTKIYSCIK
jgi:methylase of polypeptide subunit release factors